MKLFTMQIIDKGSVGIRKPAGSSEPGSSPAAAILPVMVVVLLTAVLVAACQNPFSRPVPDAMNLSFKILLGSPAARNLSAPADFAGKRLTVRLHAAGSSGQAGTVLSSFSTVLQDPSPTATAIMVPVTFNSVPTRFDLVITGSLADTDPTNTEYYTASSTVFQANWTSAGEIELPFVKVVFPVDAKSITSFGFRASLNPGLGQDFTATISGTTISLVLPVGTLPAVLDDLVPTFAHTGKTAMVGGTARISSVTPQNFSNPAGVVYTIADIDGLTLSHTVTVTISGFELGLTVTIDLSDPLEPAINFTGTQPILSRSGTGFPKIMTVTADAGFVDYLWLLNGETTDPAMIAAANPNEIIITADVPGFELYYGAHNLTLLVTDAALVEHSIAFSFQVQE